MAKRELQAKAVELRDLGMSYSQIKQELNVSKDTLSRWLRHKPLSEERIKELRGNNEIRIERYRKTRKKNRETRLEGVLNKAENDIGILDSRESWLAGLFLYWGEGGKTKSHSLSLSNTDPSILRFFISWLESLGAPREQLKVRLHLYSDMDIEEEISYWSETLVLPKEAFRVPYIKESKRSQITYTQRFTHGTCNVIYDGRDIAEYVHMSLKHLQNTFAGRQQV